MLCNEEEEIYCLRNRSIKRKRDSLVLPSPVRKKRLRYFEYLTSLPQELIYHIFSFLTTEDLYFSARPVCRLWQHIAMKASPWNRLVASNDIPTNILTNWIRVAPIRNLTLMNRTDADTILVAVAKHLQDLQSLSVENCWGSKASYSLKSKPLCNLLLRCKKLGNINFKKVKIRSCRFFTLMAKCRYPHGKFLHLSYVGPVTPKQYETLKEACNGYIKFDEFSQPD